ncbi:YraN family protein [Oscillatoria sp. CS-180]|uniref:YraN family protein n=1 Tax=Oscillatoria sp. CS-180 TaxID=3021720 RepID=UPI00232CCDE6|nr:YraN family protein [Oscillatoria sp. CS-180]MDB9529006.1 YraN family protein [Oscillatoria sp. CS-180]
MAQTLKKQLGDRGEAIVAEWLRRQGWRIVTRQWHCRWGELDIVACRAGSQACLTFVEVKTRQRGSLDQGGRLALTLQKQRKLWRSGQAFLLSHSGYEELPCRFDVALVAPGKVVGALWQQTVDQSLLSLVDYIEDAFRIE